MAEKKKPTFNYELCIGCHTCSQVCPVSAIELNVNGVDPLGTLYPKSDDATCIGCSMCCNICPVEAITMVAVLPEAG